jgi:large subunit ribosomal protein L10
MRAEKQFITNEYKARLNSSPYFIVVEYKGLKVGPITELRKRLAKAGAEMHVVKNSVFKIAAKEAGVADLVDGALLGQLAVVTGQKDISTAAKVLKTFSSEFDKPKVKFGYLNSKRLEIADIKTLADLPSLNVLRSTFLALLNTPATMLVRVLNEPAASLARVIKAKSEKDGKAEAAPAAPAQ